MDALSCIDPCFIADQIVGATSRSSQIGKTKVGGIDLNKPRMRWVAEALIALSPSPGGFTASELAGRSGRSARRANRTMVPAAPPTT